jgi:NitT/TauT family transport system substrate-binding protein
MVAYMKKKLSFISYLILPMGLIFLFLTACSPQQTEPTSEKEKIRFAALRILDSLPLYVAEAEGIFAANGVDVEILPVGSAPERDQLIAASQADGMINEVMSTLFANRDSVTVQVVRICRAADANNAVFSILAGKETGVTDLDGLTAVENGISQATIIEYVVDRLIEAEGYDTEIYPKVNIPSIPDRLALLNSGELGAATLPDPAATIARSNGAVVVIDDSSHPEYGYSTIAFRKAFIENNPDTVRRFLKAIEEAVELINQDPAIWTSLMVEREILPPPLADTFVISNFPPASIPTQEQFADAVAWAKEKGLLTGDPPYSETIVGEYLP